MVCVDSMHASMCVSAHQQLLAVLIEQDILQCLLDVHAFLQILQETVEVNHIAVDALKCLVETSQNLQVVLAKLLVSILQFLHTQHQLFITLSYPVLKLGAWQ